MNIYILNTHTILYILYTHIIYKIIYILYTHRKHFQQSYGMNIFYRNKENVYTTGYFNVICEYIKAFMNFWELLFLNNFNI